MGKKKSLDAEEKKGSFSAKRTAREVRIGAIKSQKLALHAHIHGMAAEGRKPLLQ